MRLLADENFNKKAIGGALRIVPHATIARVQDVGLEETSDPAILEWAATNNYILITHDARTMTRFAYERLDAGLPLPGVIVVPSSMAPGEIIDDLVLVLECSTPDEWSDQVRYFPL